MAELKGQEIFAAGTWNGMTFTEADLDGMVKAFDALNLAGKVPLKFGHDSPKPDGQPALGWVSRVWREGKKLLADFTHVPDRVMQLIRDRAYKHVSVELLQNVKAGTREIPWVPDGIALLGADQPAVGILKELTVGMSARLPLVYASRVTFTREIGGSNAMDEVAELRAKLQAAERREHVGKLRGIVQSAVDAGEAAPAALNMFSRQFGADDSDSIMSATPSDVRTWLTSCAPRNKAAMQRAELATRSAPRDDDASVEQTPSMKFTALVKATAEEMKYTPRDLQDTTKYVALLQAVRERNPALWSAYAMEPFG